jgi:hypothetical protein
VSRPSGPAPGRRPASTAAAAPPQPAPRPPQPAHPRLSAPDQPPCVRACAPRLGPARFAFGAAGHSGRLAKVPAGAAPLTYDVTLVTLESAKEKWEMSGAEKVGGNGGAGRAGRRASQPEAS